MWKYTTTFSHWQIHLTYLKLLNELGIEWAKIWLLWIMKMEMLQISCKGIQTDIVDSKPNTEIYTYWYL
jgi:hypothetical protein